MSSVDYSRLAQLPSDYYTGKREEARVDLPWFVINFLPITIKVYVKRWNTLIALAEMPPRSKHKLSPGTIQHEDELHVFTSPEGRDGPDYEITRPVKLRLTENVIRIGDVTYSDKGASSRLVSSAQDINAVRIHNRLTIPLEIKFRGGTIARVDGDDGMGYMAGSPNNVYVTNAGYGFKLNDELEFTFQYSKAKYITATLTDNYTTDIYVGVVTQDTQVAYPDIFSYHI